MVLNSLLVWIVTKLLYLVTFFLSPTHGLSLNLAHDAKLLPGVYIYVYILIIITYYNYNYNYN